MDGLRIMRADVENQHQAVPRSSGKLGLGGGSAGGAQGKQQGATPLRRKALGDITNSRANGNKQNSNAPSAKQNPKGGKVEAKAASVAQPVLLPAHVEDIDVATRFAAEEEFSDPAVDLGIDELLAASGPAGLCGDALSKGGLKHRAVKYEEERSIFEDGESEELMDMQLDDDDEGLFDMGEGLLVLGDV